MSERARLFVQSGPDAGRSFGIAARATLGRSSDCEVRLRGRSVSRAHARIERTRAGWQVLDLGSTNGVVQHGRRIERAPLADGDELALGNVRLCFRLQGEPDAAPDAGTLRSSAARELLAARPRAARGLLGGDLGQRPAALQAALVLAALLGAALFAWGVFAAVRGLRGAL